MVCRSRRPSWGRPGRSGRSSPRAFPFVIYGSIASASIGRLLLGGAIPGVLMGIMLMIFVYVIAKRRGYPSETRATWRELFRATAVRHSAHGYARDHPGRHHRRRHDADRGGSGRRGLCLLPRLLRLSRDRAGPDSPASSPNRSSARPLSSSSCPPPSRSAGCSPTSWRRRRSWRWWRTPTWPSGSYTSSSNIAMLVLGCFMEGLAVMIMAVPVLLPILEHAGIDLVHFGVVFVLNIMIGTITPPVGTIMYVVLALSHISIAEFAREVWPFVIALVIALLLVTYMPGLALWLPNLRPAGQVREGWRGSGSARRRGSHGPAHHPKETAHEEVREMRPDHGLRQQDQGPLPRIQCREGVGRAAGARLQDEGNERGRGDLSLRDERRRTVEKASEAIPPGDRRHQREREGGAGVPERRTDLHRSGHPEASGPVHQGLQGLRPSGGRQQGHLLPAGRRVRVRLPVRLRPDVEISGGDVRRGGRATSPRSPCSSSTSPARRAAGASWTPRPRRSAC